ncbi:MATE family efflux transporter [Ectobacillus sp. JY-23]|nr:MATE family efflux transporter [Ectobacillus sp. JY-23]
MVGQLGESSIAAVGIANKYTTILIIMLQGFGSGAAIFTAQYWGKKDMTGIKHILLLTFGIMSLFSLLFMGTTLVFSHEWIALFSNDPAVIKQGASFIQILSYSYFFTAATILFSGVLASVGQVKVPMYGSVFALLLNTVLNYLLIGGNLGLPALGVEGAAIATVVSRFVQCTVLFWLVWHQQLFSIKRSMFKASWRGPLKRDFFRIATPSILNHITWTLGDVTYFWIYASMGTDETAAVSLVDPLIFIFIALFSGISQAAATIIGNSIGAGEERSAQAYARRFLSITTKMAILSSVGIVILSSVFIDIYRVSPAVATYAKDVLFVYAIIFVAKMLNMVNNIGILRAGGDTRFVFYVDTIGVWALGLPLAAVGAYLQLPIYAVYGLANVHECARAIFGVKRTLSGKWIRNVMVDTNARGGAWHERDVR